MSQGKSDKFLPIFFGVLGAGVVAFGYLGCSASSAADEAQTSYETKLSELNRLEKEKLSRTDENADKKKALVKAYEEQIGTLGTTLAAFQVEEKPIANDAFQRELKKATDDILAAAKARGVTLGEKFDLGMGRYLSDLASGTAAPRLNAQLAAIVFLANAALEAGVLEINSLTRQELEFEKEKQDAPAATTPARRTTTARPPAGTRPAAGEKKEAAPLLDEKEVLERQPLSLTVTGKNQSILKLLQSLANTSPEAMTPHFFVIRTLRLENAEKDGPAKGKEVQVKEAPNPDDKDKPFKYDAEYLLGFENIKMQLDLDIVRFIPAPVADEKGKPAKAAASTAAPAPAPTPAAPAPSPAVAPAPAPTPTPN